MPISVQILSASFLIFPNYVPVVDKGVVVVGMVVDNCVVAVDNNFIRRVVYNCCTGARGTGAE